MIPKDPGTWTALFTFLTALTGAARWLIRVFFVKRERADLAKAKLDMSVERTKADNAMRLATALKETVEKILPTIARHESIVSELDRSVKHVGMVEQKMTEMMSTLQTQYANFQNRVNRVQTGGDMILSRLKSLEDESKNIKTEVQEFKSGNIFVKNKK